MQKVFDLLVAKFLFFPSIISSLLLFRSNKKKKNHRLVTRPSVPTFFRKTLSGELGGGEGGDEVEAKNVVKVQALYEYSSSS